MVFAVHLRRVTFEGQRERDDGQARSDGAHLPYSHRAGALFDRHCRFGVPGVLDSDADFVVPSLPLLSFILKFCYVQIINSNISATAETVRVTREKTLTIFTSLHPHFSK